MKSPSLLRRGLAVLLGALALAGPARAVVLVEAAWAQVQNLAHADNRAGGFESSEQRAMAGLGVPLSALASASVPPTSHSYASAASALTNLRFEHIGGGQFRGSASVHLYDMYNGPYDTELACSTFMFAVDVKVLSGTGLQWSYERTGQECESLMVFAACHRWAPGFYFDDLGDGRFRTYVTGSIGRIGSGDGGSLEVDFALNFVDPIFAPS